MSESKVYTEIEITDFKDNPGNDSALAVICDVRRPGPVTNIVCVYFSEDFLENYFRIPWNKDPFRAQQKIIAEKRALFELWAVVRIERSLREGLKEEKIFISYQEHAGWAEKVEKGMIKTQSEAKGEGVYRRY